MTDLYETFSEYADYISEYEKQNFPKIKDILKRKNDLEKSNIYDILCYGLVSEKYDEELLKRYPEMINKCKKILNDIDNDKTNLRLNELNDDEIILLVELGFEYYIYEYIETNSYKNYINIVVNRLNKIYNNENYSYFFSIFNVIYERLESKKYFKWLS